MAIIDEALPFVLKAVSIVVGFGALTTTLRETWLKFRSRADLKAALRADSGDASKVKRLLMRDDVDGAADVVRKYADKLPEREKSTVLSALAQTSQRGRVGYIRDAAGGAQGTEHEP